MGWFVVTGATHGMGAATCTLLRQDGHAVFGVARSGADINVDLGTPDGRSKLLRSVEGATDRLDGIVTCAALKASPDIPAADIVSVNYFGTVDILKGLRPLLQRADAPAAIAIGSVGASTRPGPLDVALACLDGEEGAARSASRRYTGNNTVLYAASKLALAWWVRRAAVTPMWAGAGISLNMITPGWVRTRSTAPLLEDPVASQRARRAIPLQRAASPDEFARVARFLLGPDARFFCGSNLFWDGGTDAAARPDAYPTPPPG